jgi:FkbM family methyltransferase
MIIFKPHQAVLHAKLYLSQSPIIVEAGAYKGAETIRLAQEFPQGTIYAFEPVPELFTQLVSNTAHLKNVHCVPYALGPQTGNVALHLSERPEKPGVACQANSLLKPKERLALSPLRFEQTIQVPCFTLDDWATQANINHIDLLWLDLQGIELPLMQASPAMLKTVKVILTEVEFVEAYENQAQYPQVRAWLESQGFNMVGKDFSDNPDWFFGNALFVRE